MNSLEGFTQAFSVLDWIIVGVYLSGTVVIGLYVNRYIKNMADYMVAGRSLRSMLGVATMIGSELGLVTVMFAAQKGFTGGMAAFHIGVIAGAVALVVGLTGFIVVPLRHMRVKTVPEFYEKRFSRGVRILGGVILALAGILNMGLFLKAGALFVAGLTGLTDPTAIKLIMTVLIVMVVIYTILGGMVSVVVTDYAQFVFLSGGMLLTCILAVNELGWSNIVGTLSEVHGEAGFNPFVEGAGFGPSYLIWMIFSAGLAACAIWQTAVMRASAADSTDTVKRLYMFSSIGFMVRFIIPQFLGVCALTYIWQHEGIRGYFFDANGAIIQETSLQAMPVFLNQILPVGLVGLIGAGMLAAFMSTHDSYLLCWASVLAEDVVNPLAGEKLHMKTRLLVARTFILIIAAFLLIWSLWYELSQDLWDYMAVTGAIYFTGAFALMLGGLYWRRGSTVGAYCGLITGLISVLGLTPVREALGVTEANLGIAVTSERIGLFAVAAAIGAMVVGSLLFPDKQTKPLWNDDLVKEPA